MTKEDFLPNILIFMADEMRGDSISLEGQVNSIIQTPHLDKLASEGAAFTNCYTVNPVCVPSRCCTFTGQYVHSNGHRSLYQLLQPHEENLFKFLKEKGYEVIWLGRNDLFDKKSVDQSISKRIHVRQYSMSENPFPKGHPLRKSFYFGKREKQDAIDFDTQLINKAIQYIKSNPKNPFCLYVALNFPHPPYVVEEPFFSKHNRNDISLIPSKLEDKPKFMKIIQSRYGLNKLGKKDFQEIKATYYGMISRIDSQFGQITTALKEIGEYDSTAIFFLSDHGDYAGDYGLTEKWPNAFQDCLIKVPLLVKIPGIKPKKHLFDDLVQTIDLFPTILKIANIETPYTHFAKNLLPLINEKESNLREEVYAEGGYNLREPQCFEYLIPSPDIPLWGIYYDKTNIQEEEPNLVSRAVMVRTKLWKLVIRDKGKEELYDLLKDPTEIDNLIDVEGYEKIILDLKERLLRWFLTTSDNADWRRARFV